MMLVRLRKIIYSSFLFRLIIFILNFKLQKFEFQLCTSFSKNYLCTTFSCALVSILFLFAQVLFISFSFSIHSKNIFFYELKSFSFLCFSFESTFVFSNHIQKTFFVFPFWFCFFFIVSCSYSIR